MIRTSCVITVSCGCLLLAGCSTPVQRAEVPVIDQSRETDQVLPPSRPATEAQKSTEQPLLSSMPASAATLQDRHDNSNPAVEALVNDAEHQLGAGRFDNAAASIERALQLAPKNAVLWHHLATVRLAQQNWQQAYVLANKSISLARGDRMLQISNWEIIARARSGQGDKAGATRAREAINRLNSGR